MEDNLRNVASLANNILSTITDGVMFVVNGDTHLELQTGDKTITIEVKQPSEDQVIIDVHNGSGACIWQITASPDGAVFDAQGFNKDLWAWDKQEGVMELADVTKMTDPHDMLLWEMQHYNPLDGNMLAEFLADVVVGMSMV